MQIVLAIILVTIFGAVLYWVGASSPKKLIAMLRLEDLTLMKIIVKSLVDLMGGTIAVESELGSGTTFVVDLNFEEAKQGDVDKYLEKEDKKQNAAVQSIKGRKVLLVEDHPLNAEIATRLLQRAGCTVEWAKNGREGVDTFSKSENGLYDVILMDIRMPVMDGLAAAKTIRALNRKDAKTVPIIALTANAYEEDAKKSIEAGMNAHLGKPIDPKELYKTISKELSR